MYQKPRGNNKGGMHDIAPTLTSNCYEHNNLLVKTININDDDAKERPQQDRIYDINGLSPSLNCIGGGNREPAIAVPCLTPDRANKRQNGRRFKNNNDPMFTLTSQDRHGVMIKSATKKGYEEACCGDSINFAFPDSQTRGGRVGKGRAQTLDTHCNQGVLVGGLYTNNSKDFARGSLPEKSRCLKSNKHDAGVIFYNGQKYYIRKLTPLECWRLQAWDDESFFRAFFLDKDLAHKFNIAYQRHKNNPVRLMQWAYKQQKMSDSQLYKQAGNGVTVEVIRRIGLNFKEDQNGKINAKNGKGICN